MTRALVCALLFTLKTRQALTAKQLAAECGGEVSTVREWLYEFEVNGFVRRWKMTSAGKSSGRSSYYWEWIHGPPSLHCRAALKRQAIESDPRQIRMEI
jgi:predicted ArsR family transcriptional regulator